MASPITPHSLTACESCPCPLRAPGSAPAPWAIPPLAKPSPFPQPCCPPSLVHAIPLSPSHAVPPAMPCPMSQPCRPLSPVPQPCSAPCPSHAVLHSPAGMTEHAKNLLRAFYELSQTHRGNLSPGLPPCSGISVSCTMGSWLSCLRPAHTHVSFGRAWPGVGR